MTNKINQFFLFYTDEIIDHHYIDGEPYFFTVKILINFKFDEN